MMRGPESPHRQKEQPERHILIVDDEPRIASSLKTALERSGRGYRVTVVHSGEEALGVLERSSVDLLVTDLRMPGISGLDLIRWARSSSPRTRTILITAYGDDEVEAEVRRLEAYRYITKPFNLTDFTQAVEEALGGMALLQPGLLVLSDDCFEAIAEQLECLRREIGAQCVFLADMQGQRLVEVGSTQGLDAATMLALLAGGIAASVELGRQLGDEHALNLNFHEGSRYDIYSAPLEGGFFLAIVCDRRVQASRVGLVWFYTRRTIEKLRSTLLKAQTPSPSASLGTDFGDSLARELDSVLSEELAMPSTPSDERERKGPAESTGPSMTTGEKTEMSKSELIDLETAIERGIISSDLFVSK